MTVDIQNRLKGPPREPTIINGRTNDTTGFRDCLKVTSVGDTWTDWGREFKRGFGKVLDESM